MKGAEKRRYLVSIQQHSGRGSKERFYLFSSTGVPDVAGYGGVSECTAAESGYPKGEVFVGHCDEVHVNHVGVQGAVPGVGTQQLESGECLWHPRPPRGISDRVRLGRVQQGRQQRRAVGRILVTP